MEAGYYAFLCDVKEGLRKEGGGTAWRGRGSDSGRVGWWDELRMLADACEGWINELSSILLYSCGCRVVLVVVG